MNITIMPPLSHLLPARSPSTQLLSLHHRPRRRKRTPFQRMPCAFLRRLIRMTSMALAAALAVRVPAAALPPA
jgi:hypothetical protein